MERRTHATPAKVTNLLLIALAAPMSACAGPKFLSTAGGAQQTWAPSAPHAGITVRVVEPSSWVRSQELYGEFLEDTNYFVDALVERLEDSRLFSEVRVVDENTEVTTPLLLEVMTPLLGSSGWGGRAMWGTPSLTCIAGRLVAVQDDSVLMTFWKSRSGEGGMLGDGGLLSAGDQKMTETHLGWIAEDLTNLLRPYGRG